MRQLPKNCLLYGLQNGRLVSICDVPSGLACNCICPACKSPLVAKKGSYKKPHFAHYNNSTSCERGHETSIHLLAKEILSAAQHICLPAVTLADSAPNWRLYAEQQIEFSDVFCEQAFSDIIPDITIKTKTTSFFVEIYVTHKVDEEKLAKLRQHKISTLEIDLSDCPNLENREEFRKLLIDSTARKKWVYNRHIAQLQEELKTAVRTLPITKQDLVSQCPSFVHSSSVFSCESCPYFCGFDSEEGILCIGHTGALNFNEFRRYSERKAHNERDPRIYHLYDLCDKLIPFRTKGNDFQRYGCPQNEATHSVCFENCDCCKHHFCKTESFSSDETHLCYYKRDQLLSKSILEIYNILRDSEGRILQLTARTPNGTQIIQFPALPILSKTIFEIAKEQNYCFRSAIFRNLKTGYLVSCTPKGILRAQKNGGNCFGKIRAPNSTSHKFSLNEFEIWGSRKKLWILEDLIPQPQNY